MDLKELTTPEMKDFGEPITPFASAYPDPSGKIAARNIVLSRLGDVTFVASPNIGNVDTTKFFKDPRRIWAELELGNQTPADVVRAIAKQLAVSIDLPNNKTVTMKGQAQGTIIIFDKVRSTDKPQVDNPLIEDRRRLPELTFVFEETVE